jgi:hypothetical protein
MIGRLRSIARTIRELSRRAFRVARYGDAESVSFFDRHTPELAKTGWPSLFLSKAKVIGRYLLQTIKRLHAELLSEERPLIPDPSWGPSHSGYAKYYVGQAYKNAVSLWHCPRGESVLPADGGAKGISFFVGRHLSETRDSLLEISLDRGAEKRIFSKKLGSLEPGWNTYSVDLCGDGGNGSLKFRWELKPARRRAFISGPLLKTSGSGRTLLVLVVDAVRPDAVGLYSGGGLTPEIDRFFGRGAVFENSFSQSNWTLPAFASMALSQYASQHHVVDPDLYSRALDRSRPTLAEILRRRGFFTYGSVSHRRCNHSLGHHRGFEHFRYAQTVESRYKSPGVRGLNDMGRQLDEVTAYLKNLKDVPFFGFVHLFDTHFPFFPNPLGFDGKHLLYEEPIHRSLLKSFRGKISSEEVQYLHDCFLSKLAEVDARLAELFRLLEQRENATVILTSDHGYSFANPLGNNLSDEEIRTPFLVYSNEFPLRPGRSPRFVESSVDLLPTILSLYGIPDPAPRSGTPLFRRDGSVTEKTFAVSELVYHRDYRLKVVGEGNRRILFRTNRDRPSFRIDLDRLEIMEHQDGGHLLQAVPQLKLDEPVKRRIQELMERSLA